MTDPKTAAMVEAMLQRNENFRGTSVNEAKMNLFTQIRQESDELAHLMRGTLTEEQIKKEAARCLGCGCVVLDEDMCVFDATKALSMCCR